MRRAANKQQQYIKPHAYEEGSNGSGADGGLRMRRADGAMGGQEHRQYIICIYITI